ncbi:hypothetical protein GM920_13435 [Pedobacter sp. LMG 31462]|uniref:O-antigen ligase-related domain-containing protein n=2 Tax=Pedobacter gandavensis TaxID=2679963 RepID=A0ABR6EXB1_9SPHI|nr:hypothetical protein [Pedobacter gandavensis]
MFFIIMIIGIILYLQGKKYFGLLIFLFLLTDGFQFVPEPLMLFGFNLYGKDYALIFTLAILMSYLIAGKVRFPVKSIVFVALLCFLIYLVFAAYIDLAYYNPSFSGFMLMFRVNLFLLTYFWLDKIDKKLFERLFKTIFIITVIQSILCLIQIPTGLRLLTGGGITAFDELGIPWVRYTNLPYFLMPCLFILLMNKTLVIHYKGGIIVLFLITILFTLTRTLILGLILTMGFAVLSGLFNQQKKVIFWFVFMFILTLPIIGARLLSSTDDINAAVSDKSVEQGSNMTFAYRIFHVTERYLYVSKDPKHEFFGIGFIHERDFPKDTFLLGHRNEKYEATQLEQDDVSWSNLFLRYGIFGTVLYMFIFVAFVVAFFKQKTNGINAAAIMFMIMTLILSFASGKFSQADYFLVPMFFFFYIRKSRQDAETKESNVLLSTSDVHKNS